MWIWDGKICPSPGERIEDAAREAILLALLFRGGSKCDERDQQYDVCFSFRFNDTECRVFADSTIAEICEEYDRKRAAQP